MAKISNREIRQLIIERIKTLSPGRKISIGKEGDFSKEELIKHIQKGDKIGEKITKVQLSYLRSMKKGIFFNEK
ncbi:hypothetical protein COT03_01785 [Candidatus Shapirobacteria bacterium CG07_land_8_20_14_0_80_39_18]|uniref:Uncharacterized protein n=1 Tax=Candidatus Shapirobacteria bacterium CG07_land_8_20_14_0_80_39_18 TaxID=1974882 RepID=A0A2M6YRD4_9BACT|nr:MAG: hypothetical protein COT03_01785 [Candidatus Shapirobacteria bacterium CG07_land_8_20_14_0_80_39_18]